MEWKQEDPKFDPECDYVALAVEYIKTCGRENVKDGQLLPRLPKLVDFYIKLDISREAASEWRKKSPNFNAACNFISSRQEATLEDEGLYGGRAINAAMAIFLLKANHGKIETEKRIVQGTMGINLAGAEDALSKIYPDKEDKAE